MSVIKVRNLNKEVLKQYINWTNCCTIHIQHELPSSCSACGGGSCGGSCGSGFDKDSLDLLPLSFFIFLKNKRFKKR